jgi:hypothetical protein
MPGAHTRGPGNARNENLYAALGLSRSDDVDKAEMGLCGSIKYRYNASDPGEAARRCWFVKDNAIGRLFISIFESALARSGGCQRPDDQ